MTPTERRRSRRGEGERLRDEILAAAQALLLETADTSAVSVRAIADRVGVTPPSIYRHFADKDALMMAVCGGVFSRLDEAMEKAASGATDPYDEVLLKGRAYVEFGLAYPEHYRLIFMIKQHLPMDLDAGGGAAERPGDDLPGSRAFQHLQDTVHRLLEQHDPAHRAPDEYAMTCAMWTGVHGITSLRISLPHFPWPPLPEQIELLVAPWRELSRPAVKRRRAARR